MNQIESTQRLLSLINASVSPYHAVNEAIHILKEAGFSEWKLTDSCDLEAGKGYYTNIYGTTLVAFYMPTEQVKDFRIAAAHTDNPCFRIKPNPDHSNALYGKLNLEAYGGAILNTWMDRPLSIAGRVCLKGESCFTPKEVLYQSKKPVAVIPNLAIHMNREVNKGVELKVQKDMEAILTCFIGEEKDTYAGFTAMLAKELGVEKDAILDYDLYVNNHESGRVIGYEDEMIQAPRLDNLTSCSACVYGLLEGGSKKNTVSLIALFDNEECGSRSKQGADSTVLVNVLEKIAIAGGMKQREDFINGLFHSFLVSIDVAHAAHPNHIEKSDPTNRVSLKGGVIIKMNTNQRYATDTSAIAVVEAICREEGIAHQKFVNHADIAGGGTLGSIMSATIPAKTVDIGVPLLGMHSSCELMAGESQLAMDQFVAAYFKK